MNDKLTLGTRHVLLKMFHNTRLTNYNNNHSVNKLPHARIQYTHAYTHACTHARTHARTHTHTQPFYISTDFVHNNLGESVPEETFTHSSIVPYLLHLSTMIHGILPVQSVCLTVIFHNLAPSFLWSTSWPGTLNFILHNKTISWTIP